MDCEATAIIAWSIWSQNYFWMTFKVNGGGGSGFGRSSSNNKILNVAKEIKNEHTKCHGY